MVRDRVDIKICKVQKVSLIFTTAAEKRIVKYHRAYSRIAMQIRFCVATFRIVSQHPITLTKQQTREVDISGISYQVVPVYNGARNYN